MLSVFLRPAPMLAVLFGLGLTGCAAVGSTHDEARAPGGMFNPGSGVGAREAGAVSRGARPVAALPAAAGRVVDVREKRFGNGFTQEIALAADAGVRGENMIVVSVRDQPHPPLGEPEIEMPREREDEIAAEIEKRFAGASLRFHDTVLRNAYGPYGLASGRVGAMNCVYLWQSLDDLKPHIRTSRFSPYKIETSVRVRLCRSGATVSQLAYWAANLVLDTGGVAQPPGVASAYAGSGGDPLGDSLDQPARSAGAQGFVGYAAPAASAMLEEPASRAAVAPRRRAVARYAHAPRRYARRSPVSEERRQAVLQGLGQPLPPQGYAVAAQPALYAAQPGQVIWTQPGAAALARSAAPAYGASAGAAAGSVGLPPQAYGGPAGQIVVPVPR